MCQITRLFLKNIFRPTRNLSVLSNLTLKQTNDSKLILTEVNDKSGFALVTLNRPPVNSFNLEFLKQLSSILDALERDKTRGVILNSSIPDIFSLGLDISYLQNPDVSQLRELWSATQDCWLKIYGSSFPIAAAASGKSFAGGCYFLMSCEYRVMTSNSELGVNGVSFGIPVPSLIIRVICNLISKRQAEIALTTAKIFSAQEAYNVGLIDEIASDADDAIARCEAFLNRFQKSEPRARSITKQRIRQKELNYMRNNRKEDVDEFVSAVQ